TFNWVLTARHSTATWEYLIGNKVVASFNDGGAQPGATKSHTVNFAGYSGRQTVLARWNISDTVNAFYSCVDLNFGGATNPTPTPTATSSPTPTPTATTSPTATPTPKATQGATTWAAGTTYKVGDRVTYSGKAYQCRQAHTAISGWEPPYVAALWAAV
ncbi:carbohydrate-binding protein, partial [Klenkia sp. LSe6-5]